MTALLKTNICSHCW